MNLPPGGASKAALYAELRAAKQATTRRLVRECDPARFAAGMDPKYVLRPHLEVIGRELDLVDQGETNRVMIFTPPQVGKSVLIGEWAVLWWLARHPTHRIVLGSYAASLAELRGRHVRTLIETHGPDLGLALRRGSSAVDRWELETGGGMRSVGVGGALTGFSASCGFVDDPHKDRAEANSQRQRDLVWDWWSSTFLSRLAPGAPAIVVQTRWHPDDLAGRLLDQEGRVEEGGLWRVVRMPAIADQPDDPLGREPGDPLTHPAIEPGNVEELAKHWADKRRTSITRDWHALYQADPRPAEGALLSQAVLVRQRNIPPPEGVRHAVGVDPSGGGRDLAGIIGGHLGADGRLYITHDRSVVGPSDVWSRRAMLLAAEMDAELLVLEANFGADMALLTARTAWKALQDDGEIPGDKLPPRLVMQRAKKGKLLRAEPVAQQWLEDRVRTGALLLDLEDDWQSWQPDDPDSPGRLDASVHLAYAMLPIPGREVVVSSAAGVIRSQVQGGGWASIPISGVGRP